MNSDNQIFLDFSAKLYHAESIDDMFSLLESSVVKMGFDNVSYTYLPRVLATSDLPIAPVFKISKDYNHEFIERYSKADFVKNDFTIRRILSGDLSPIDWWQQDRDKRLTKEEFEVIEVAREEYQIRNGLSLPTYTDGCSLASVSLISEEKEAVFSKLYNERVDLAHRMAHMFSDRVLNKSNFYAHFYQPFINQLSPTEKQVLLGLAKGVHLKTIAENISRDYKYISNFVVNKLRRKFGNVNRDRLLFEAGANHFDQILDDKTG